MKLNEKTQTFIEKLGLMFEHAGATRIAGRMMGLLLVSDRPLSLAEMSDLLHVSKASMSTNSRLAQRIGMAHQVSLPGDRRDFYEIVPESFENMLVNRIQAMAAMIQLTNEGLQAIDEDNTSALARLEKMKDFYEFFFSEMESALGHWRDRNSS